ALRRRLPSWVAAVGLFVDEPPDAINRLAAQVGLDVVQLHGDEDPAEAQSLQTAWWKAIRVGGREPAGDPGIGAAGVGVAADEVRSAIVRSLERYRDAEF